MENPSSNSLPPEVIQAFIESASSALRELVQLDAMIEDYPQPIASSDLVVATIRLLRSQSGKMTLVLDTESASHLAEKYLPVGSALSDEMVNDVAAEFANVIAGQAKTILKGTPYHFTLSIPEVSRKNHSQNLADIGSAMCITTLRFDKSQLELFLTLSACPGA